MTGFQHVLSAPSRLRRFPGVTRPARCPHQEAVPGTSHCQTSPTPRPGQQEELPSPRSIWKHCRHGTQSDSSSHQLPFKGVEIYSGSCRVTAENHTDPSLPYSLICSRLSSAPASFIKRHKRAVLTTFNIARSGI